MPVCLSWLTIVPLVSWSPSLCRAESKASSVRWSNLISENSLQHPCHFQAFRFIYCTLSTEPCASTNLANRASRTSSNRLFYRGVMTPITHACKARHLTTVGRASLSVIDHLSSRELDALPCVSRHATSSVSFELQSSPPITTRPSSTTDWLVRSQQAAAA